MASEDYNLERGIVQGSCSWVHDASSSGLSARLHDCNLSEGTYVQNFPPPPPDYIEACRRIDALRRKERSAAVVSSDRPSTPPGLHRPSGKVKRRSKKNTTWHPSTGHWTWTSSALRASGAIPRCASFARSRSGRTHDARYRKRATTDATKNVQRRQRAKLDRIELLVENLELDRRTRRVCDAALGSSSNNSDVSVMRDEYLEASGPLEPVPILPFLGENLSQDHPPANAFSAEM